MSDGIVVDGALEIFDLDYETFRFIDVVKRYNELARSVTLNGVIVDKDAFSRYTVCRDVLRRHLEDYYNVYNIVEITAELEPVISQKMTQVYYKSQLVHVALPGYYCDQYEVRVPNTKESVKIRLNVKDTSMNDYKIFKIKGVNPEYYTISTEPKLSMNSIAERRVVESLQTEVVYMSFDDSMKTGIVSNVFKSAKMLKMENVGFPYMANGRILFSDLYIPYSVE